MGLEPMISRTTIWRANQLHHTHHTEPGGIRTLDLRLRRPLLYPAELQTRINFIPVYRLLTDHSVRKRVMGIEPTYPAWKAGVLPLNYTRTIGVTGFEPATSWSQTRRSSQAEPHPDVLLFITLTRDARIIISYTSQYVNNNFNFFYIFFAKSSEPLILRCFRRKKSRRLNLQSR